MANNNTTIYSFKNNTLLAHGDCEVRHLKDFLPTSNPDNVISGPVKDLVRKLMIMLFLPLTSVVGVPANVINMAVFYKHGLKERINVCLFALSLADGLFLLFNMLAYGEHLFFYSLGRQIPGPVFRWILNHYLLGCFGISWVSQAVSAIIASERCFCILQPFRSQTILRTCTMTAIIVTVSMVLIGGRMIVVTRYYMNCFYIPVSDSIIWISNGGDFYHKHRKLVDFLDVFLYGTGLPWVVIIVVVVTTTITVIKLRQAAEWRAGMSSCRGGVSARDIALTRMLVRNSIFFIACVFPVGLFRFVMLLVPDINTGRRYHNLFITTLYLLNIITYINSTFNIVVYYTMSSRYRHTVCTMLGRQITTHGSSTKN